jgi:D-alanyl-D-alanine carboxypeptidase (penicillin-binding protein 5/6)
MKKIIAILALCAYLLFGVSAVTVKAQISHTMQGALNGLICSKIRTDKKTNGQLDITSPSVVLMEGSTGTVIYAKDKDKRLKPASITKIMTMLLIFDAIESGQIELTDEVSVSEHAASMGGSQVFLEPYEVQNVETMIKCISIASANDASTAMSEFIAGSEEEFVARMNQKAKELGMENTNFVNCCGLDTDNHYSSAYDVALMSRNLITKHPQICNYSTVWMDTIIHTTKKGQSEFGLTNTNKLVRFYDGITGLKTGSTGLAKYCLSATARRNNMDLIAVIMAAPNTKTRFFEASKLLNYGFANNKIYHDDNADTSIAPVRVIKGVKDQVAGKAENTFSYLCFNGKNPESIRKEVILYEEVNAPVAVNDRIGEIVYYYDNEKIGSIDILALEDIKKAKFKDCFIKIIKRYFLSI